MDRRWSQIQNLWQSNQFLFVIAGFLLGILFFPAIEALSTDASDILAGFVPEAVGIGFTVLLIDRLYQRREREREERELKARLVREARSKANSVAKAALEEIDELGLLRGENGILKGENLRQADLSGVYLATGRLPEVANLEDTIFWDANLADINLRRANLEGASLDRANLSRANLSKANLQHSSVRDAQLQNSDLTFADLQGADLSRSNLAKAHLEDVEFDHFTILPDGIHWTPDTDMTRFTDPNHPDFWQPEWAKAQEGGRD